MVEPARLSLAALAAVDGALEAYDVLDSAPEQVFDDIVSAAAEAAGCATALVSLLDVDRQWFKARLGLEATRTPRDQAFCEHALRADAPLVVTDTMVTLTALGHR